MNTIISIILTVIMVFNPCVKCDAMRIEYNRTLDKKRIELVLNSGINFGVVGEIVSNNHEYETNLSEDVNRDESKEILEETLETESANEADDIFESEPSREQYEDVFGDEQESEPVMENNTTNNESNLNIEQENSSEDSAVNDITENYSESESTACLGKNDSETNNEMTEDDDTKQTIATESDEQTQNKTENQSTTSSTNEPMESPESSETVPETKPILDTESTTESVVEEETEAEIEISTEPETEAITEVSTEASTEEVSSTESSTETPEPESNPVEQPTLPTPIVCTNHTYSCVETKVLDAYQLYNYVEDTYTCSVCGHTTSELHIATNGIDNGQLDVIEKEIVACVNNWRAQNGLSQLSVSGFWVDWAQVRAEELSVLYGHKRPDGSDWGNGNGMEFTLAENIASGQSSGYNFFEAFKNSPQHNSAMLLSDAISIAVGLYINENGSTYCAMIIVGGF